MCGALARARTILVRLRPTLGMLMLRPELAPASGGSASTFAIRAGGQRAMALATPEGSIPSVEAR